MNAERLYRVVTTIQPPTAPMRTLGRARRAKGGAWLVVGDSKGPARFPVRGTESPLLSDQQHLPLQIVQRLPMSRYARKNAGDLVAISRGAGLIYEADDDNYPAPGWQRRQLQVKARIAQRTLWRSVYRHFNDELIWPRGLLSGTTV